MVNSITGLDDVLEKIDSEINLKTEKQLVDTTTDVLANGGEDANFNGQLVRLPVYPKWFFTARIGQPRKINYIEIRKFAKSPWVQMVLSTIKKEVSTIPFDFELVDEEDEQDYTELKKELKQFFNKVDDERNSIVDLCNESITDLGEIDALAWVKVYSADSYEWREVDIEDDVGNVLGTERRPMLKPFGQRKLLQLRNADPATFLKQIDIFKRLKAYYQYSWKNPRSSPIRFEPDEVAYNMLNKRSHELYGFSPVQSIQQVLELLIQSTRYNKDFFRNNAFPDGMISLPGANAESMKQFKEMWLKQVKGKPHKLIWHNTDAKFNAFNASNKDMEWLEGQKWYFHLVFGAFGVSPVEAGFHENVNMGNTAGQERVTIRNAIKPFLQVLEDTINKFVLPELLQEEHPPLCFRFQPIDHGADITEFDQAMRELQAGTLTTNEWRAKQGREALEGGDEPSNIAAQRQAQQALDNPPGNRYENNNEKFVKQSVIAIGPRGGRIIGYRGDKPIYQSNYKPSAKEYKKAVDFYGKERADAIFAQIGSQLESVPTEHSEEVKKSFEALMSGNDSKNLHTTNGKWNKDRKEGVHKGIKKEYATMALQAKSTGTPKVVYMAGLPASGKTTTVKQGGLFEEVPGTNGLLMRNLKTGENYLVLNSDDVKTRLPEYNGLNASYMHEESSAVHSEMIKNFRDAKINIIVDGTLKDSTKAIKGIQEFKNKGYETGIVYVDTPVEKALEFCQARYERSGRFVPYQLFPSFDEKIFNSINSLKSSVDTFERIEGGKPLK